MNNVASISRVTESHEAKGVKEVNISEKLPAGFNSMQINCIF
ncbi:unnamed protein product [Brugia timori]|uniref:Uncharacterized protein n=1 Tax=Brugia timori TaxID=42155 RepID=A0A3P7W3J1_9BILA|nr:unnamed protein product [Brugia timori]